MKFFLLLLLLFLVFGLGKEEGLSVEEKYQFLRDGHIMLRGLLKEEFKKLTSVLKDATNHQELNFVKSIFEKNPRLSFFFSQQGFLCQNFHLQKDCNQYLQGLEFKSENLLNLKKTFLTCQQNSNQILLPYFQVLFPSEISPQIKELVQSKKLGRIAADLLDVDAVRYYQDGMFIKESSASPFQFFNNPTGWHTDLNQVPLRTNHYVTMWCAISDLSQQMSVMTFVNGSHRDVFHLANKASFSAENDKRKFSYGNYQVGDVTKK